MVVPEQQQGASAARPGRRRRRGARVPRRALGASLLVLFAGACNEYELQGEIVAGEPNPPSLDATVHTDRVVQTTVASVDVLWVIDTSCSMLEEQAQLNANFAGFMTYFLDSGLDYHIGVVSTNMDDPAMRGKLQPGGDGSYKFIDPETPEPLAVFEQMAVLGTDSHASEKGRAAAYTALTELADTENAGFYREDANLAIIVISDENDYSGTTPISFTGWVDWLSHVKPDPEMVSFSSIVGEDLGGSGYWALTCDTAAEPGFDYFNTTRQVGGIEWSICDENWDLALEALGMQAAGLKREFFLSQVPVVDTLHVEVVDPEGVAEPFLLDTDFVYERSRNSVRFIEAVPEPLSEVLITYEVAAGHTPGEEPEEAEEPETE